VNAIVGLGRTLSLCTVSASCALAAVTMASKWFIRASSPDRRLYSAANLSAAAMIRSCSRARSAAAASRSSRVAARVARVSA